MICSSTTMTPMALSNPQKAEPADGRQGVRLPAVWSTARSAFLIATLQSQADQGNRSDHGFKKQAWEVVVKEFNEKFNVHYDKEQFKTHFHWLRQQYLIVRELRDQSGIRWNEKTCAVEAPEAVWAEYLKSHPKAKVYKDRPFPLYNALEQLTAGVLATGAHRKSTSQIESSNAQSSRQHSCSVGIEMSEVSQVGLEPRMGDEPIQGDVESQPLSGCSATHRASPRRSVPSSPEISPSENIQRGHATSGRSESWAVERGPNETLPGGGRTQIRVGVKRDRSPTPNSVSTESHRSRASRTNGSVALAEAIQAWVSLEGQNGTRRFEEMRMCAEQMRLRHEDNKAQMEHFPHMKQAMKVFWDVVAPKFSDDKDRLRAAKLLRNEEDAAFFLSLPEHMQSYWLEEELKVGEPGSK